ncbi:MAG TPA: molybdenum cofactor biosynthesis protein MoaE [Bryobacteraceae bacterium]|nr:molybdenum cofactor biosynthesis protein MoaE [Bryobacteraceae bacterium]
MHVRVLFFGMLKDVVGRSADEVEIADGSPLRAVFDAYADRYPRLRDLAGSTVLARNREFSEPGTCLVDGDEVAFLPPVSGGSPRDAVETGPDGHYFSLTRHPIDTRQVASRILTGADGAVVTFEGIVRNNTKGRATLCLDYEGYEAMALPTMARIGREIAQSHAVTRVAMVHRLGRMLIGETSVAVLVAAPHRRAAFEAALEGINRLKKLVPIWKKEHFVDGEVWVEGEWDRDAPVVG